MPITPSGTRCWRSSSPLGSVYPRSTSPTGSGNPATWRRPAAIPSTRMESNASRSSIAVGVATARAASRSSALAARICSVWAPIASAADRSAASLAAVGNNASAWAATRARRAASCTSWRKSGRDGACTLIYPGYRSSGGHVRLPHPGAGSQTSGERTYRRLTRPLTAPGLPHFVLTLVEDAAKVLQQQRFTHHERLEVFASDLQRGHLLERVRARHVRLPGQRGQAQERALLQRADRHDRPVVGHRGQLH